MRSRPFLSAWREAANQQPQPWRRKPEAAARVGPGPRGGGPRARALWPPAVLRRRRLRSRLRRREDGWHGGPGERALHPLRSRQLPAGGGEVWGVEPWAAPLSLFTSLRARSPAPLQPGSWGWRPPPWRACCPLSSGFIVLVLCSWVSKEKGGWLFINDGCWGLSPW